jgi:ankyrin repeat protein
MHSPRPATPIESIDPNKKDVTGRPPLVVAVIQQDYALVAKLLMTPGIVVNQTDADGNTAFHKVQTERMARLLTATGRMDFNKKNRLGHTPIAQAVLCGRTAVAGILQNANEVQQSELAKNVKEYMGRQPGNLQEAMALHARRSPEEKRYHARMKGLHSFFARAQMGARFEASVDSLSASPDYFTLSPLSPKKRGGSY